MEKVTFAHAMQIFAYQLSCIDKAKVGEKFTLHFYGGVNTGEVNVKDGEDTNKDWDQFTFAGNSVGNRCGARDEFTKMCTPILEKIARGDYSEGW